MNFVSGSREHNNLPGECGNRSGGKECGLNVQYIPEGRKLIARLKPVAVWARPFDDSILLPGGREIVTLRDAGDHITSLPKAEQDHDGAHRHAESIEPKR